MLNTHCTNLLQLNNEEETFKGGYKVAPKKYGNKKISAYVLCILDEHLILWQLIYIYL